MIRILKNIGNLGQYQIEILLAPYILADWLYADYLFVLHYPICGLVMTTIGRKPNASDWRYGFYP